MFGVFKDLKTNKGFQFWLELKCNKLQKVIISPKQIAWHYAHAKHGGVSFVLVKISAEGGRDGRVAVFPGKLVRELVGSWTKTVGPGFRSLASGSVDRGRPAKYLNWQPFFKSQVIVMIGSAGRAVVEMGKMAENSHS